MEIIKREYKVYTFDELTEEAQYKAIEHLSDINVDYEWYEYDFEDYKTIGAMLGIEIKDIFFSGFYSQGDGACFTGRYEYKNNSVKSIKEYAPEDNELHKIAEGLYLAQKVNFYRVTGNIEHRGHYYHSRCTDITLYNEDNQNNEYAFYGDTEYIITELLRDFMNWIYHSLNKQYEYLTSREAIIETIVANDYSFTEDGKLFS